MKNCIIITLALVVAIAITAAEPALAGPGGKIARAVYETFWGKLLLGVLTVVFFPLLCYMTINSRLAERRARKDLAYMACRSAIFDWLKIQERAKDCFFRVHSGWENADLSNVSSWMTDWYWQNQQQVFLDKWNDQGLVNVCSVRKIKGIRPLLFAHRNHAAEHQDSMVVISITADMQDYLKERRTGKVVEGSTQYKDVQTIWSFTLENGQWKVSNIEEGSMSLAYENAAKDLPKIENTVVSDLRA